MKAAGRRNVAGSPSLRICFSISHFPITHRQDIRFVLAAGCETGL
jgi:hypothetical protein